VRPTYDRAMDSSPGPDRDAVAAVRVTVTVRGRVQGVGFRWWTRARALELGLAGHARNTSDGRVEVVVQGAREAVDRMVLLLREHPSSAGRPGKVVSVSTPLESAPRPDVTGFVER
jgi:acylphosphatase